MSKDLDTSFTFLPMNYSSIYGPDDPFAVAMRPDYKEPKEPSETIRKFLASGERTYRDILTTIDLDESHTDGYNYGSHSRMMKMRKKGAYKPVGPGEMYKFPLTTSMNYGFWKKDEAIDTSASHVWYEPTTNNPLVRTDVSKHLDAMLALDRFYKM